LQLVLEHYPAQFINRELIAHISDIFVKMQLEKEKARWNAAGADLETDVEQGQITDTNAVPSDAFTEGDSFYTKLQAFAGKLGVEQRGIERVPSDERTDSSMSQVGTLVRSSALSYPLHPVTLLPIHYFQL
jgi:hypothetical protein